MEIAMTNDTVDFEKIFTDLSVGDERLRVLKFMDVLGLDTIRVNYSGGGDSGSIDDVEFLPDGAVARNVYEFVTERFEEVISQPVWDTHGSFADGGGYSVSGTVIWDAKQKEVSIQGTHHYYELDENCEETESNDEDFAETCYEFDEEDPVDGEPSFDMLYAYAKFVLKDKFPGEYHNRMLAAAMEKDKGAFEYVKWVEGGRCK
jgi:hypothetical protein